ncbi:hypothetical protein VB002_03720 [Campylobacter concisus]
MELLKDNVCIIDTPGIDDAVVLREQITTNFTEGVRPFSSPHERLTKCHTKGRSIFKKMP